MNLICMIIGHKWSSWTKEKAICQEKKTCTCCGEIETRNIDHVWGEWFRINYKLQRTCDFCGEKDYKPPTKEILMMELEDFCKYVEENILQINGFHLIGSLIYKSIPRDIDVIPDSSVFLTKELLKDLKTKFPDVHICFKSDELGEGILVWDRKNTNIKKNLSSRDAEIYYLRQHLEKMREELKELRASSHSNFVYGYG